MGGKTTLKKGDIVAERFRIDGILGVGGYASVFRATHLALERPVALKVLDPTADATVSQDPAILERFFKRFEREAKIVSKLQAPETVEVYEFGRTGNRAYMALELVEGKDLLNVMNAEAPMEPERVEKILSGILRSLREAHELGVLHRDIKPANVMVFTRLGEADCVKMLDFGVVRITRDIGVSYSRLTSEGNVVGTPRYMAPEYIRDNIVNPQTDLYGLGIVAWEMLVGRPAIDSKNAVEVMTIQVSPEPMKLPESVRVSPRLRAVVDGLLEKDPRRRFESADDVLELIETGRLAGFTQDDISLAATLESHEVRDVADAAEPATETWERPASPSDVPEDNREYSKATDGAGLRDSDVDGEDDREYSEADEAKDNREYSKATDGAGLRDSDAETRKFAEVTPKKASRREKRHDPRREVGSLGDGELELDWPDETPAERASPDASPPGMSRRLIATSIVIGILVGLGIWWYLRT